MTTSEMRPGFFPLLVLGASTGLLSGVFGIGGGVVLVPLLVLFLHFPQRLAAGTSVAAILPAAIVGGITYAINGNVDWIAAACLAAGIIGGAQLGSYLLAHIPTGFLNWMFMTFLLAVVVSLWFIVPQRDDVIEMNPIVIVLLVLLGFATGVLSGLLGVGGGVVIVPILMFGFGASDLIAKGTSLIMLIPGSVSGTLGNIRRKNIDVRAAMILGLAAALFSPLGTFIAIGIEPFWSNVAFSILLAVILLQMLLKAVRKNS